MGSSTTQSELWSASARDWAELQEPLHAPVWKAMLDAAQVGHGTRFFDAGCGGGGASALAAQRGAHVSGLDASEALIAIACERVPQGDFRVGDLEALPFGEKAFDTIIAALSVQYAADPIAALRELKRVCALEGYLVISTWGLPEQCDQRVVFKAVRDTLPSPPPGSGPFERFLQSAAGAFNIFTIYLGDRLGLYRPLAEHGPLTSAELAAHTGTQERYVREWLEQQTVAGILEVVDETHGATARRFRLPPGHVEPLIDCSSLNYLAPLAQLIAGAVRPLDEVVKAYRHGGGVPFSAYGADLREGQAAMNCSAFTRQLAREWLLAIPDVHARLQADPPARVADIGCGHGWSSIGLAQGYPNVRVDGFDLDGPSIDRARQNARAWRLTERVQFHVRDAGDPALAGQYDLAMALECVHDMSNPIGALRSMRRLVGERGTVLVVDERVGDTFTSKGNEVEWLMYGFSVLHCLPSGMTEPHSAGTGTVMRTDPRTFVHCAEGASPEDIAHEEQNCARQGWRYRQLSTGHDAMITAPQALTELLLEFV